MQYELCIMQYASHHALCNMLCVLCNLYYASCIVLKAICIMHCNMQYASYHALCKMLCVLCIMHSCIMSYASCNMHYASFFMHCAKHELFLATGFYPWVWSEVKQVPTGRKVSLVLNAKRELILAAGLL